MEQNMSRPLSLIMAGALVAGTVAMSAAPASAIEFGVTARSGEWHNEQWRDWNDDWRWRGHRSHFEPGFSFNIGVPFPTARAYYRPYRERDCYREWDGSLYCRAY
jgi:hypothetical protein